MELLIEHMTHQEVKQALVNGMTTAVVPCGAIEQHGPHMRLRMDTDHADELGLRVAAGLGSALVAPTVVAGCSRHHLAFTGTISLRPETFEAVCTDYCTSLATHGFRKILFFSAHLGNCPVLAEMLPRLAMSVPATCQVFAFSDALSWIETWRAAVAGAGGDAALVGGHADIAETSIELALSPDGVRLDRTEPGRVGTLTEGELEALLRDGVDSIAPNGILGSPTGATREIGAACVAAITTMLVDHFSRLG